MKRRPRLCLLILAAWALAAAPVSGDALAEADRRDAFRQLGELRAGVASRAREKERLPLKAAFFYLQAAQAFRLAGQGEKAKQAVVNGLVAAQPLRAAWLQPGGALLMSFLPGDKQVLTCARDGRAHLWDVATGREVRSFQAISAEKAWIRGAVLSPDLSRLLVWDYTTIQLSDVGKGRILRKWGRAMRRTAMGPIPEWCGITFLAGGKYLLLLGTQEPAGVWDADGKARLHAIDKGVIRDAAPLSRDRSRLLTADSSAVYLWDLTRGRRLQTFKVRVEKDGFLQGRFSEDARRVVVTGGRGASARVFDASTGEQVAALSHPRRQASEEEGGPDGAVFSPDGTRLLTWNYHREARLWDVESGRLLHTFRTEGLGSVRFHRGGTQVLTTGEPVVLWDAKTRAVVARYGTGRDAEFLRDGTRLLIRNLWDKRVEVWDAKREKRAWALETGGDPGDVRLSEDETLLLVKVHGQERWTTDEWGAVQLWNLPQTDVPTPYEEPMGPLPRARLFKHDKPVRTAALSQDEGLLLTCDEGGQAHLWDAARGWRLRSFAHGEGALGAALSPDGSRVVTWGERGVVKLWEAKAGKAVRTFDHAADVREMAFSPDGTHLLTRDADYTVRWWDVARAKPVHQFEHPRDVFGARLSPKGRRILTWGLDGKARLWDVASGRRVHSLAHRGPVFGATFAGEGIVWTWSADGLREWDVTNAKVLRRQRPGGGVAAAERSPDGKQFLLRTDGENVRLWDVGTAKGVATFPLLYDETESPERLPAGVFHPDGTRVVIRSHQTAELWDVESRRTLKRFRHPGAMRGAVFTRDGSLLLTWGADGTARLWETAVPRPLSPDDQLLELEARSGLRLDEGGSLQILKREEWEGRRKKLAAILKKNGR
jgi:WD40 repeat protein